MFVTEYHWGVLVAQGTNGGLFYAKVIFTENFWSPVRKKLESFFEGIFWVETFGKYFFGWLDLSSYCFLGFLDK